MQEFAGRGAIRNARAPCATPRSEAQFQAHAEPRAYIAELERAFAGGRDPSVPFPCRDFSCALSALFSIAAVFVLGVSAQWIAWRYRVPSILLLLTFGFIAGPVTGVLDPEAMRAEWVFTFVALSIGIILFEGGLSLRLDELREVGGAVGRLISIGVLITWVLAALASLFVLKLSLSISLLIGAILTVTGPTVIVPILRHIRPKGRIGALAKWEGITIDPIGAILALLVLETLVLISETGAGTVGSVASHALKGLLLEFFVGVGIGVAGAGILVFLLRRRMVPDYLQNPMALMVVIAVFAVADALQPESGLVATTIMGFAVANQRLVAVRRIVEFKEDLRVLLIAALFIMLAAQLNLADIQRYIGWEAIVFLLILMVFVRPLAVFASMLGTRLHVKEKVFLSWLAPRGIVAAAVASLFTFRIAEIYPEESQFIVPIIFLVIVGTVAIYGLTISPLARWLGLAEPDPQGVLFVGAHDWARRIATVLDQVGVSVLMVDANASNVASAREAGLHALRGNVLSESIMDELDLSGIGRLVVLTPNDEVNSLTVVRFAQVFDSAEMYQLATRNNPQDQEAGEIPVQHLRGRPLFGAGVSHASLAGQFASGATVKTFAVKDDGTYPRLEKEYGDSMTPLFVARGKNQLQVLSIDNGPPKLEPGNVLIALIASSSRATENTAAASAEKPVR